MSAAKQQQQTDDSWLPKARAAKLLGASMRQLERRTAQGFIEKKVGERKPTERNPPVFYSREDILAFKAGTPNRYARLEPDAPRPPKPRPTQPDSNGTALARVAPTAPDFDAFAGLAAHLAKLAAAFPSAPPKPWLTLDEAHEYSGLPKAWLLTQARRVEYGIEIERVESCVLAVNVGTAKRARWMFNREALAR